MDKKFKILCFFDNDSGRDVEILMPLIYYAENYLNSIVEYAFIWDIHAIYRKKPNLVLLANTIGSNLHHEIAKYAYLNKIKVFALISEGNFRTDGTYNHWGYNVDKKIYQEYICLWSERTKKYLMKTLPENKNKMVLTGALGFDRYKIYKFTEKNEFLSKYNFENFDKVIGYAGWAFGKLFNETGLMEIKNTHKEKAEARISWMKEQMLSVESILRQTIEKNQDILFILKRHPNEIHPHLTQKDKNEMINLVNYPNVIYVTNEENIHTLISVSDIWLGFESTSVIETWLMKNSPTIFVNPDPDFYRDKNYKGTVIAKSANELQCLIDEYYKTGKIEKFLDIKKLEQRESIITDIVGFSDGLNHLRAGFYLKKTLSSITNNEVKVKLIPRFKKMYILMHLGKYFYNRKIFLALPKFKKTVWIFDRFRLSNIAVLKKKYFNFMDKFYEENSLKKKLSDENFWSKLIQNK